MIRKFIIISSILIPFFGLNAREVKSTFNPEKVILPSSQYTPASPYMASVWVFNDGQRYSDQYYNKVWATPPADSKGQQWYEPDYQQEDSKWQTATAPFSSDEYYRDQRSYRWVTVDIMGEMYMRRTFTIDTPIESDIFLTCGHDDAPSEWYINGELVHTASDGWNNDEYVLLTPEQKSLIKMDGSENVLAVHVHQNWGGAFADCGLYEADMTEIHSFLPTLDAGAWPCRYYMLNYNSDFADAENAGWASPEEDESDWIDGFGPFSNDENMFYTTEWPSQERPILIRRHFTLSESDLNTISDNTVTLRCSYDENPKVYLNGNLIWSSEGWNDDNYLDVLLGDEQKQHFVNGDNVLAVSLMQGGGGGHIDYGLILESELGSTGIIPPAAETRKADNRIYNLSGQYLGTEIGKLPKGIYIQGNKKIIKL